MWELYSLIPSPTPSFPLTLLSSRESMHVHDHRTSRQCDDPACRGILEDSIINFGEMLPQTELTNAFNHAQKVRAMCVCMQGVCVVCVCVCACVWCMCVSLYCHVCRLTCALCWDPVCV